MFKKYRWNFVTAVLTASVVGFLVFDLVLHHTIKNYLFEQTQNEMRMKANLAVLLLEQNGMQSRLEDPDTLYAFTYRLKDIVNTRVTIIDTTGRVRTDSDVARDMVGLMDNHIGRPEVQEAIAKGFGQSYRRSDTIKRKLFYTALPITYNNRTVGFFRLAYYAERFEESMRSVTTLMVAANLVGLVFLFFLALFLGSVFTFPVLGIVRTAQKIASGDLEQTFPVRRKDEIGTLAIVLNQLTGRLKSQISQVSSERSKLQDILASIHVGVIVVDRKKDVLHTNPEVARILSLKDVDKEYKSVFEIVRHEPLIASITRTMKGGQTETGEFELLTGDTKKYVRYTVTPFFVADQKIRGAVIELQDISELKKLEAIRRDFVANASHELKTPLTAIVGYTEILLESPGEMTNDQSVKFVRRIREQAQRLEFLVADLLKLSELEREKPVELLPCSLSATLQEVREELGEQFAKKGVELAVDFPEGIKVEVDQEGLRTVLYNLVDNALKYTPEQGTVTVRATEARDRKVKIEVVDTGIGIDPKYHDRIFQRFYRVDEGRSRALGGTGLGLAIVKHIIERHGGHIHVESDFGKGSRFWFELNRK